jgi:tetratricopeptide (TPR) repeat protein
MRERQFVLSAILAALCVTLFVAVASAQPSGRVNGVVRDEDGEPIKGATISARHENSGTNYTATSDNKGRFNIIGLRPGEWIFVSSSPGFGMAGARMQVRVNSNLNPPIQFSLRRTGPGAGGALEKLTAKALQEQLAAADALFNQQRWDEAIAAYRKIMAGAAPLSFINLQLAEAYLGKNDLAQAQAAYEELLKFDPASERAVVGLAELKLHRGDRQGAEDVLLQASQGTDPRREVLLSLGELTADSGRPDEALEWFRKASAADPYWGKPLYRLAQLSTARGDAAGSTSYMERVIAVDPQSPEAALAKTALGQSGK